MAQRKSADRSAELLTQKVLQYETFLNETLREDLRKVLDERDKVYGELADYLQLKNVIEEIQENKLEGKALKTKVDLGCNFYVQAKVPDSSKICVCVGYGFYVEFTLSEAVKFISKRVDHLTATSDALTKDASRIKANVKLVLEGLRELQGISDEPPDRPRRDIF